MCNKAHQFQGQKVKDQRHQTDNAEAESVSPMNFKLGRRYALSTAMTSYKGR